MFLGRPWRKKRRLLLQPLPVAETTPPLPMSYWRPPTRNVPGQEQGWYDSVFSSHNAFCGCGDPVGHINNLATRLGRSGRSRHPASPDTPPPVRPLRALPAPEPPVPPRRHTATENQPWPGTGGEGGRGGDGDGGAAGGGDDLGSDAVEELLDLLDDPE